MVNTTARTLLVVLLFVALLHGSYLARLEVDPGTRDAVVDAALPVYKDLGTCLILPLSEAQFDSLRTCGRQAEVLDSNLSPGDCFIVPKTGPGAVSVSTRNNRRGRQERQANSGHVGPTAPLCLGDLVVTSAAGSRIPGRVLWENDNLQLVRMSEPEARALKAAGLRVTQLRLVPRPLPSPSARLRLSGYAPDTTVAQLVSLVSEDSLVRTIQDLEDLGTRYSYNPKCESAAFYLRDRLAGLGYTVRLDTYYLTQPTTRAFNVEATLEGTAVPESIVVACGHFDSYNGNNQNDAPGADDNATGTAAVVELARVLKQARFRWSVKFLCFSGEEQWMKGSYHWVDSTAVPQNLKIAGAYNLDMFGYAAYDTDLVFVNTNTASRPLADLCDSTNSWYSIGLRVMNYLDEDIYGDNTPFWEAGYLSVFALEDSEWGIWNGSNPYYHSAGDTFGTLTMSLVTRTTKMAAACLATIAVPDGSVGMAEGSTPQAAHSRPRTTFIREVLYLPRDMTGLPGNPDRVSRPRLVDVNGRKVLNLRPGRNNVTGLAPGVYFIRTDDAVLRRAVKLR